MTWAKGLTRAVTRGPKGGPSGGTTGTPAPVVLTRVALTRRMAGLALAAAAATLALPAGLVRATDAAAAIPLPTISADLAAEAVAAGEITLIDIRTPEEWRQSGIARGARMLSMQDPAFWPKFQAIRAEAPDRPVALICATGGRSGHVGQALIRHGVTGLYHVSEGMMGSPAGPGWLRRGLPVEKP